MQQIKKGDIVTAVNAPERKILVTDVNGEDFKGALMCSYRTIYSRIVHEKGQIVTGLLKDYTLCVERLIPFKQGDIVKGHRHIVLVSEDHDGSSNGFSGTVIDHTDDKTKYPVRPKGAHSNGWSVKDFTIVRYATSCVFKPGDIVIDKEKHLKVVVIGPGENKGNFTGMCIWSDNTCHSKGDIAGDWISDRFDIYKEPHNLPVPKLKDTGLIKPSPVKKKPLSSAEYLDHDWPDDDSPKIGPAINESEPVIDPFVPGATFVHVFKDGIKVVMTGPGRTPTTFSGVRLSDGHYSNNWARKYFRLVPSALFETGTAVKYHNMVIKVSGPGKNPQTFTGVVITGGVLPVGTYSAIWLISEAKEVTNEDI